MSIESSVNRETKEKFPSELEKLNGWAKTLRDRYYEIYKVGFPIKAKDDNDRVNEMVAWEVIKVEFPDSEFGDLVKKSNTWEELGKRISLKRAEIIPVDSEDSSLSALIDLQEYVLKEEPFLDTPREIREKISKGIKFQQERLRSFAKVRDGLSSEKKREIVRELTEKLESFENSYLTLSAQKRLGFGNEPGVFWLLDKKKQEELIEGAEKLTLDSAKCCELLEFTDNSETWEDVKIKANLRIIELSDLNEIIKSEKFDLDKIREMRKYALEKELYEVIPIIDKILEKKTS